MISRLPARFISLAVETGGVLIAIIAAAPVLTQIDLDLAIDFVIVAPFWWAFHLMLREDASY